jgi:hypothetical protein
MIFGRSSDPQQKARRAQLMAKKQWGTVKASEEQLFHLEKMKADVESERFTVAGT